MKKIVSRILTSEALYNISMFLLFLIAAIAITLLVSGCTTAHAQGPEDTTDGSTVTVTVDDIIAVTEQLQGYDSEINILAQLVYAEARGVDDTEEQAGVIWCVLNRVDATGETIKEVVTSPHQFAYHRGLPVKADFQVLAKDVLTRWLLEKRGIIDVGRVLPADYLYFAGHGGHNWFRNKYLHGKYWRWDCRDPYESEGTK